MKIETKFNHGDFVYPILENFDGIKNQCKTCDGTGRVHINGSERTITCPDCCGRGYSIGYADRKWKVCSEFASEIGKISVEHYAGKYKQSCKITYMIETTGVGSGTAWYEHNLFLTLEEAQKECDKRNSKK